MFAAHSQINVPNRHFRIVIIILLISPVNITCAILQSDIIIQSYATFFLQSTSQLWRSQTWPQHQDHRGIQKLNDFTYASVI